jgi:uncharacterized protein YndB with AHSA1/START domain
MGGTSAATSPRYGGRVEFEVPLEIAFDYLADPRNRPQWQSSLARVELLDGGAPRVGMRWRDHTRARIVPEMEITAFDRPRVWAESGHWRGIRAVLSLDLSPSESGCSVEVGFQVAGRGLLRPVGWLTTRVGGRPVLADVRRAARILSERERR